MIFHFIGIGGAGMSVIAEILAARGHQVQGSDGKDSATVAHLRELGIWVATHHDASNLGEATHVVVSSAIKDSNPELQAARAAGLPVWHRSQALWFAAGSDRFVAVAGAHGKTTTSGMIVRMVHALGEDPSFAVGSPVAPYASGGRAGSSPFFIAEADESDGSFLNFSPDIALITNIEPDHLDHYGSYEAVVEAFGQFARQSRIVVCCQDDPLSAQLAAELRLVGHQVLTYGFAPDAQVHLSDLRMNSRGSSARLTYEGEEYTLALAVVGEHNVLNAAGAWAAGVALGFAGKDLAAGLETFQGTDRRFSLRGEVAGTRVFDDYAHHPTEIAALVQTARQAAGQGKVHLLFQPHLYSRTQAFAQEFAEALSGADNAVLTPIYAAREQPTDEVTSQLISDHAPQVRYYSDQQAAIEAITAGAVAGDVIVTVGAGDITNWGPLILAALAAK